MPLSAAGQAQVQRASRASIDGIIHRLRRTWRSSRWLPRNNPYRKDSVGAIDDQLTNGRPVDNRQLGDYIAASVVAHCLDGWAYLGRAIASQLHGDGDVATHLAYYAELRAAMSILAAEGVGVFSSDHFILDAGGACSLVEQRPNQRRPGRRGTHSLVWLALEHWANQPTAKDLLLEIIAPGGQPLRNWLAAFTVPGANQQILAAEWLKNWGLDLQRLSKDRDSRNIVSYRPTAFTSPRPLTATQTLYFVRGLWELCEPMDSMRFPVLDRHLLRHSIERAFQAAHGKTPRQLPAVFRRQVDSMMGRLTPRDLSEAQWREFLLRRILAGTPQLISDASGVAHTDDKIHSRQVLARATLLLRLASGAADRLLRQIMGFTSPDLGFWWLALGEDRALWAPGGAPANLSELWASIRSALEDLEKWEGDMSPSTPSYERLWREQSSNAAALGSCERIGLWGVGL